MHRSNGLGALRAAALLSASAVALGAAAPASAQSVNAVIKPYYGTIKPFYGTIKPFEGDIDPLYGTLRPFYGTLRPFYGTNSPFTGDMVTYWGGEAAFAGKTKRWWGNLDPDKYQAANAPAYLTIAPYWTTTGATWDAMLGQWQVIDPATAATADYAPIASQLQGMVTQADAFWGASVRAKTGKSFNDAFAAPIFAKWGINPNDPESLRKLDVSQAASFFLDWYDGLMNYAGTDHVDWWMRSANWSPSLTQVQGSGQKTVIGLLDFTVVGDTTLQKNIVKYDGISTFSNGHGAAVGSLIVGAHDRQGVMGIAPKASVIAYNPFDATGSAGWADIYTGILMLAQNGASIVNMSLGVPGSTLNQGWNDIFSTRDMTRATRNMVFVTAAGNDGYVQTNDINWDFGSNPSMIVVGSVDITGTISNFSNQPGNACLLDAGVCRAGNRLMDRFVVAPGEMILMSDDKGGWARQTGTSFAAPLVSGAIALLHDRWPWLVTYPKETTNIILNSATDLGAPGVDPVYGHGLLNIQASQSPLDFNKLVWFTPVTTRKGTTYTEHTVADVVKRYNQEQGLSFDAQGFYFYAYEPVGQTFRDFAIPMSDKLVGQTFTAASGYQAFFQGYLKSQMDAWVKTKSTFADSTTAGGEFSLANPWGADMTLSMAPRTKTFGFRDHGLDYQTAVTVKGEKSGLRFGFGDGAVALSGQTGFGLASDYDSERGGANPLLGLASGGGYANWSLALTERLKLSAGATQRNERRDGDELRMFDRPGNGAHAYNAQAQQLAATYRLADGLDLVGSYTQLKEKSALLGIQSLDPQDFKNGSTTDGLTLGVSWAVTPTFSVAASGTRAQTRASGEGQSFAVDKEGLQSSAYQVAFTGLDVLAKGDAVRLTLAQPMTVEKGSMTLRQVEVVDRQTGELGVVSHSFEVGQAHGYTAEMLYGRSFESGDFSLFGRVETDPNGGVGEFRSYMAGGRYRITF